MGRHGTTTRDKVTERILAHALKNSKVPPKLINLVPEEELEADVEVAFGLDGGRLGKMDANIGPNDGSTGQLKSAAQTRYLGRSERDHGANGLAFAKVDKAAAEKEPRLLPYKLPSEAASTPLLEQTEQKRQSLPVLEYRAIEPHQMLLSKRLSSSVLQSEQTDQQTAAKQSADDREEDDRSGVMAPGSLLSKQKSAGK